MANPDQVIEMIEQATKCEDLASNQDDERLEVYWQRAAQTRATLAVAVALMALRDATVAAAVRLAQK